MANLPARDECKCACHRNPRMMHIAPCCRPASSSYTGAPERYRHKKRGTVYDVVGVAALQNATDSLLFDNMRMVVYRGDDGKLWAREESEFHDGRFEPVPAIRQETQR